MLWISLYLPELSLQAHSRGALGQLRDLPLVISEGPATRPYVHAANATARVAGIATAMPIASAKAHAADVIVVPREPAKEHEALRTVANWLARFTPMVTLDTAGVSLEVSTSLTLFGGIGNLVGRIRNGMTALDFHPAIGVAPTPRAAYLLAKASHLHAGVRMCREPAQLRERLGDLPLFLCDWPQETLQTFMQLGFTRIRDLLTQPRAGLHKRFGDEVVNDLDRALGIQPDPRKPHIPPEHFASHVELLFETADADRLCRSIDMLLNEMEGYLHARGTAVSEIELTLKHSRDLKTHHSFGSRRAEPHAAEWLRLVRERLSAQPLPAAVVAISLIARKLQPYVAESESWLPNREARQEKWHTLLERIGSRLGEKSVFTIEAQDDHRPELAWRLGGGKPPARKPEPLHKARPLLLLKEPKALVTMENAPQHHGPLTLLAGPERIETGWWDGRPVARDYFVASNPREEVCWIYCDYRHGRQWFLHGYFA